MLLFFRYSYKLSIIEDVYNVFKNNGFFAIRVWFPPPPVSVKDHTFTFILGPFPKGMLIYYVFNFSKGSLTLLHNQMQAFVKPLSSP